MNRKHLLYHLFNYMERCDMNLEAMPKWFEIYDTRFSDNPAEGEITVANALREKYAEYRKVRENG